MFVSFAQNLEDVMLWRAFRDLSAGTYIDIGAWSPNEHSVTKAFYQRGWSGINVEPNPSIHATLDKERPRDTNLALGVHSEASKRTYYSVYKKDYLDGEPSGLSTFEKAIADQHLRAGWLVDAFEIEVLNMSQIWGKYLGASDVVHFLKVDVEGWEYEVLEGNDWERNRPWIVLFESVNPISLEVNRACDDLLASKDYIFAYDDGLNHFFVAAERSSLLSAFSTPPNVWDGFITSREFELQAENEKLVGELHEASRNLKLLEEGSKAVLSASPCAAKSSKRKLAEILKYLSGESA